MATISGQDRVEKEEEDDDEEEEDDNVRIVVGLGVTVSSATMGAAHWESKTMASPFSAFSCMGRER